MVALRRSWKCELNSCRRRHGILTQYMLRAREAGSIPQQIRGLVVTRTERRQASTSRSCPVTDKVCKLNGVRATGISISYYRPNDPG